MNTQARLIAAAAVVLVIGAGGYFALNLGNGAPPQEEPAPLPPLSAPAATRPPPIQYPVETPAAPLPSLDASGGPFGAELARALGLGALPGYVYPDQMIRRLVTTVDNLPRARVSTKVMPVRPVAGPFRVTGPESDRAISPANAARYELYVGALEKVGPANMADLYLRWYPLFQQAYVELGYPKGYFNDRLVEALDDLLAAPEPAPRVALVQPGVLYQYTDPDLEELSAGQKVVLRMGSANAARVKTVLRAFREEVVKRSVR